MLLAHTGRNRLVSQQIELCATAGILKVKAEPVGAHVGVFVSPCQCRSLRGPVVEVHHPWLAIRAQTACPAGSVNG